MKQSENGNETIGEWEWENGNGRMNIREWEHE